MPSVDANTNNNSDGTTAASVASERNASASADAATSAVRTMQSSRTPCVTGTGACPVRKTCHPSASRCASAAMLPEPGMP